MIVQGVSTQTMGIARKEQVTTLQKRISDLSNEIANGQKTDVAKELGARTADVINMYNLYGQTEEFKQTGINMQSRMRIMAEGLSSARDASERFLSTLIGTQGQVSEAIWGLQEDARGAILAVLGSMNGVNTLGRFLFGGVQTDNAPLQDISKVNPRSGFSPEQVAQALAGTIATPTDAAAAIANFNSAFNGTNGTAGYNYEETFYNGTPLLDGLGNPNPRLTARIDFGQNIVYGVQANDAPVRQLLQGLWMIASVDVSTIPPDAREPYILRAIEVMQQGLGGIRQMETRLGAQQAAIDVAVERHQVVMSSLNEDILASTQSDMYETQARLSALETQLQATYQITSRVSRLSLTNFL
jgi:flagellar hook-associated protein 3 FlgL